MVVLYDQTTPATASLRRSDRQQEPYDHHGDHNGLHDYRALEVLVAQDRGDGRALSTMIAAHLPTDQHSTDDALIISTMSSTVSSTAFMYAARPARAARAARAAR